ncbi:LysR family transcriptional regulator [Novosphingobium sp. G106]|uniref:LysR family transcriptional regulator n=1 Tax=Novosphingobium sp. G106 TaxID=2849500 RepID=UPI001C2D076F|nr:LysR family transcriptional regulator [Novosphingobium sp. G106]MBV1689533.1 LysR family transcriptional regulator [Novosphingobium sp. G106]
MAEGPIQAGLPRIDRDFARNLDWNLLKVFMEIVRAGGIGAAARSLNKQQPSISAALKRLEDQLGARLFERSTGGIRITQAGKALQVVCEEVFDNVRMAQHQVAQATKRVSGEVRIQLISSIICPEFDEAIASFKRRHPAIAMELRVSAWRGVLEALARGEVEVGIGYEGGAGPELIYEPMFVETQQLFCARSHPLYGRKMTRLEGLEREGFVLTGADEAEPVTRLRSRHGLGQERAGQAEDVHEALRLITLGVGIGFLPVGAAALAVDAGKLWPLLPDELQPSYDIYLISRADPSRDTATQLFLDEIRRRLRAQAS